jgi:hypothetical protein
LPDAARRPAIEYRQQNLDTRTEEQRAELVASLEKVLSGEDLISPPYVGASDHNVSKNFFVLTLP